MRLKHVVLVTRQFWPRVGGAEIVLANLARALDRRGIRVTVLTARWQPEWPDEFMQGNVRVLRLPQPPLRFWGTWRYMRALQRWLRANRGAFDLVYVSMLKHDAYAVLGEVDPATTPVVLRPELGGPLGDVAWQRTANFGRILRARTRKASAIVAIAPWVRDEVAAVGYPPQRVVEIANGVVIPPERTTADKLAARAELAGAHAHLELPADAPLAIFAGRLHASKGVADLVAAWPVVLDRRLDARLWILGEGPEHEALARQIRNLGLQDRVVLAGQFDMIRDFHLAADLVVHPSHEELMSIAVLEAMAAGLPIVASDIPGNSHLIVHERHGLLAPRQNPPALAAAVLRLLEQPLLATSLAAAARQRAQETFSIDTMANAHIVLFEQLIRDLCILLEKRPVA